MNIQLEADEFNAVQAYTLDTITVGGQIYNRSLILSKEEIISNLTITNIKAIDNNFIDLVLKANPKVIIVGHNELGKLPPMNIIADLNAQEIGIECMSIGAACRTYNILLSEGRPVVAAFILEENPSS